MIKKTPNHSMMSIRVALAAATSVLLQGNHAMASQYDTSIATLYYTEKNDGIQVIKPAAFVRGELDSGDVFSVLMTTDVISGATPTGAVIQDSPQTMTSPSGNSYVTQAGKTPVEKSFEDLRVSVDADYQPKAEKINYLMGLYASKEKDYSVVGVSGGMLLDNANKNTAWNMELGVYREQAEPENGMPSPLTPMLEAGSSVVINEDDTKDVIDVDFGMSQILSRMSLIKVNFNINSSDGYLTNPYKVVSVLDNNGDITSAGVSNIGPETELPYIYEKRPDSRLRRSILGLLVQSINDNTLHTSYRYYWDDWDIDSQTLDVQYRINVNDSMFWQPHVRWYQQHAADFYRQYLLQGQDVSADGDLNVSYLSADYRLSQFTSYTLGLAYGMRLKNSEFVVRAEWLEQKNNYDQSSIDVQNENDLKAMMLQVEYSMIW